MVSLNCELLQRPVKIHWANIILINYSAHSWVVEAPRLRGRGHLIFVVGLEFALRGITECGTSKMAYMTRIVGKCT